MKQLTLIIIGFLIANFTMAQEIDLTDKWIKSIERISGFKSYNKDEMVNRDFSKILSNQFRYNNDPISTYIGIFGPKYRRIDFHLKAIKKGQHFSVTGKSKLEENVRELKGQMKLKKVLLREQDYITDSLYIGLFDCKLQEPGDKDGDGIFTGIFTTVFYIKDNEIQLFKTSSGDEPNFANTFVGKWTRYNSSIERKVIFSFHPAGLYEKLPFCDEMYTIKGFNDDYYVIKSEYEKFGWKDYDYKKKKTEWWK